MTTIGYLACLIMGLILGLMGGGGSILTVPILVYLFGYPPVEATSLSLFVVAIAALFGSASYIKGGKVELGTAITFALPGIVGVYLARIFVHRLPEVLMSYEGFVLTKNLLIMILFSSLMMLASFSMIKGKSITSNVPKRNRLRLLIQGFAIGIIVGFVGVGGGFLIVPILVIGLGMPMRAAVGTSLLIIGIQSAVGFGSDIIMGMKIDWTMLLSITGLATLGILFGAKYSNQVSEAKLKKSFGFFVLILGLLIMFEQVLEFLGVKL